MNTVSWMIYLTNVIPSLGIMLGVLGVIGGTIAGILVLPFSVTYDSPNASDLRMREGIWRTWKYLLPLVFVLLLLANLVPDTSTMRLILASELGEQVITNPEVIEIFDLLKENLKVRLKEGS